MSYRSCLEGLYLAAFRMPPSFAETNESRRRVVQTLVWFTSSLIISVYVKDIQYAVTLIGGLAALFIFFFPGKQITLQRYNLNEITISKNIEWVYIFDWCLNILQN